MQDSGQEPLLFGQREDTLDDSLTRTSKFSNSVRFTLSCRVDSFGLDIIEALAVGRYAKRRERSTALQEDDRKFARLRVLLRLAHRRV